MDLIIALFKLLYNILDFFCGVSEAILGFFGIHSPILILIGAFLLPISLAIHLILGILSFWCDIDEGDNVFKSFLFNLILPGYIARMSDGGGGGGGYSDSDDYDDYSDSDKRSDDRYKDKMPSGVPCRVYKDGHTEYGIQMYNGDVYYPESDSASIKVAKGITMDSKTGTSSYGDSSFGSTNSDAGYTEYGGDDYDD